MNNLTLTDRLAQDPKFIEAVQAGVKLGPLRQLFPGYGQTTVKEARRKVRFLNTTIESAGPGDETVEYAGDRATYTAKATQRITTLQQLLDFCEFDPQEWEVERWSCNKWEVGAKDENKVVQVTPLYQVKATFRRRVQVITIRQEIESMRRMAESFAPVYPVYSREPLPEPGNLWEVSIFDLHVGKLAWARECGEPYDVRVAEGVFRKALEVLRRRAMVYSIERILYVVGQDLLHVDSPRNATYNGTPQDHDSRFFRTFERTRELMVEAIDTLTPIADVDVLVVPGNHDQTAAWHLGDSLRCWYRNSQQVRVDNEPTLTKYYEWGQVMLMFTHGDKLKTPTKLMQIAAADQPEMWGRTRYREAHIGHLHHNEVKDEPGLTVRRIPSLSAADAHHKQHGYIGAPRQAHGYIWNKEDGLVGMHVYTVPRQPVLL